MEIGLFFGSFNPFHIGHKVIASYVQEVTSIQQVWLVVSPQNPFKSKNSLLGQHHRLMIIRIEIEDNPNLKVSDIEFSLPTPNYTIDTLTHLNEKYPNHEFSLIMGSDNLNSLKKWKNHTLILDNHMIYVYPRLGTNINLSHKNIKIVDDVPKMEISSSLIRKLIKNKKDASYLVPEKAWRYIVEMNFYRT